MDMIPHAFGNPGCGINAGAEPPRAAKNPAVSEFVADVVEEVLHEEDKVSA